MIEVEEASNELSFTKTVRSSVKTKVLALWDECSTRKELVDKLEQGFIFGEYASNKHYRGDDLMSVVSEVWLEKYPPKEEGAEEL